MAIQSVSMNNDFSNLTAAKTASTDTGSKTLQNQIANKEQRLNRLSSNSELSAEEKAKERQELQKQIAELNRKLRLLRMEEAEEEKKIRKEQEQKAALREEMQISSIQKDSLTEPTQKDTKNQEEKLEPVELPSKSIQKILTANASLQKNLVKNQVRKQKEHTEHILESEIKMDEIYGNENTFKQAELDSLRKDSAFNIEAVNAPKQRQSVGISDKAKVIVVE